MHSTNKCFMYLVRGTYTPIGEDEVNYCVVIYMEQQLAEQHLKLVNEVALKVKQSDTRYREFLINQYDINSYNKDYNWELPINYWIEKVPYVSHVDEYIELYTRE